MRFKKCQRIRRQADFEEFRTGGTFKGGADFFVKTKKNTANLLPRFAVIVSKKIGKAHERNRIKRLFREIFRREQSCLNAQNDYLVVARKGILPKFWTIRGKFLHMFAIPPKIFLAIAIDGTAASGKSSTARALAEKYRLLNVNTGDHYRALTVFLLKNGIEDPADGRIGEVLEKFSLKAQIDGISEHLSINGNILPRGDLHSESLNQKVALFARIPELRQKLKAYEQSLISLAKKMNFSGIVMEGRDISSVVMPEADVKIFLTADPHIRAQRRLDDGEKDAIERRDSMDHCAHGADTVLIDTAKNNLAQVIALIEKHMPLSLES
jgi:cytidylate kinase